MRTTYPGDRFGIKLSGIIDWRQVGQTRSIWNGAPPVLPDGTAMQTLSLSADREGAAALGQSVTVEVSAGGPQGGFQTRRFAIGGGLAADLRLGNYEIVNAKVLTAVPTGFRLRWAWSSDWSLQPSPLFAYMPYTVPGAVVDLPQGTEAIFPTNASVITWEMVQFGTTQVVAAAAAQEVEARWGSMSCNIANQFIVRLRGF